MKVKDSYIKTLLTDPEIKEHLSSEESERLFEELERKADAE